MNITEKIANLAPEHREVLAAIKDAAQLESFLAEQGIALSDAERAEALELTESGITPLSDDDLDAVAGGITAVGASLAAKADGRKEPLRSGCNPCSCVYSRVFAKSAKDTGGSNYVYQDVKCYNCGCTWPTLEGYYNKAIKPF